MAGNQEVGHQSCLSMSRKTIENRSNNLARHRNGMTKAMVQATVQAMVQAMTFSPRSIGITMLRIT